MCQGWLPVEFIVYGKTTKQALYIYQNIQCLYFSKAACIDVKILPKDFPSPTATIPPKADMAMQYIPLTTTDKKSDASPKHNRIEEQLPTHPQKTPSSLIERYNRTAHTLYPLQKGQIAAIQRPTTCQWDTTDQVIETLPNHQYCVRVDGSGRITLRYHQFLRKLETPTIPFPIPVAMPETSTLNPTPHRPNTPVPQTMDAGITSTSTQTPPPGHCPDYFHITSQV